MKKHHCLFRSGFTLVEMLIVIGVLGMLIGLLAPAILESIKVAQRRAVANECALLEEAILEFWHDQNRWPIKKGHKPTKKGDKIDYKLVYKNDNNEVFKQLIEADFGGIKKTYLDTGRHITTATRVTSYPADEAAPLKDVLEGRNDFSRRPDPVLVYWAELKPEERKSSSRGLRPFKVTIDLLNNSVSVSE